MIQGRGNEPFLIAIFKLLFKIEDGSCTAIFSQLYSSCYFTINLYKQSLANAYIHLPLYDVKWVLFK